MKVLLYLFLLINVSAEVKIDSSHLISKYCVGCHGPDKVKGNIRLDKLNTDLVYGSDGQYWQEVLDVLNRGEMPPEDETQLSKEERLKLVNEITSKLQQAAQQLNTNEGKVTLRRLNRFEYSNTLQEILGIKKDFHDYFAPEQISHEGFINNGKTLEMTSSLLEQYLNISERALDRVIVSGQRPQFIHRKIFKDKPVSIAVSKSALKQEIIPVTQFNHKEGGFLIGEDNSTILIVNDHLPDFGEFKVIVKAKKYNTNSNIVPRLRITGGLKNGKIEPRKVLAEKDITNNSFQTFEFTGRIEDFPSKATHPRYPGFRIQLTSINSEKKEVKSKKKKKPMDGVTDTPLLVVSSVEFMTQDYKTWPPESHTNLIPSGMDTSAILNHFMTRAYRRPITNEELKWAEEAYKKIFKIKKNQVATLKRIFSMVLSSPKFLYLPEFEKKANNLSNYNIASRLSYFLWSSMPDDELMSVASKGKLKSKTTLKSQAVRMLNDVKIKNFLNNFFSQWLKLSKLDSVAVNPDFFPKFDVRLKEEMKKETLEYCKYIFENDKSIFELLDSKYTFVNNRLADFYSLSSPNSGEFKKVKLPTGRRGGLLYQGSFLLSNSNGSESHPIKRGTWILERILGTPPPNPPADVAAVESDNTSGKQKMTLKEKLVEHRKKESCHDCHKKIDPWGVPFEKFNALGLLNKNKVDTSIVFSSGVKIEGPEELVNYILTKKNDLFAEAFCKYLLSYSLGRSLHWSDREVVNSLMGTFKSNGYKIKPLILQIILSDKFSGDSK